MITTNTTSNLTIFEVPEGDYRGTLCAADLVPDKKAAADGGKLLRLVFEINSPDEPGHRYVASNRYKFSLKNGSRLRTDLESWRGHDLTAKEKDDGTVDFEILIGRTADVVIEHYHEPKYARPFVFIKTIHPPGTLVPDAETESGLTNEPAEKSEPDKNDEVTPVGVDQTEGEDEAPSWL